MSSIKALETHYAGCRFRSRLEARWAVFFDRLGASWKYEPQGYLIGPSSANFEDFNGKPRPYLPDFYLPDLELWVEVKGDPDALDLDLMLNAAIPHWGLPSGDLLILGDIPRPGGRPAHSVLTFHKGDVIREWFEFLPGGLSSRVYTQDIIGNDGPSLYDPAPDPGLVSTVYFDGRCGKFVSEAYTAARSARFEHGERG